MTEPDQPPDAKLPRPRPIFSLETVVEPPTAPAAAPPREGQAPSPPPSLASAESAEPPRPRKPLKDVQVAFKDDFAPSTFTLMTRTPSDENDPWLRLNLYNQHIHATLKTVLDDAAKLGCHPFAFGAPDGWPNITKSVEVMLLDLAQSIAEQHDELSPEWLTISCYVHTVRMCARMVAGEPIEALFSHLPLIGATLRQIELTHLNKDHAQRERRQAKGRQLGTISSKTERARETKKLIKRMGELISKDPKVKNAAATAKSEGLGASISANQRAWSRHGPGVKKRRK